MGVLHKVFDEWNANFIRTQSSPIKLVNSEKGFVYSSSHRFEDVADQATVRIAITTAADEPTIANFDIDSEGSVRTDLYENSSVSDGSLMLDENLNRNSFADAESDVTLHYGVTVDTQGDLIAESSGGTRRAVGTSTPAPAGVVKAPWILDTDNVYLLEITNNSGGVTDISVNIGYSTKVLQT